ncbi:hypothetical protein COV19_02685 [Candidatus Woesearchaeota archaeon CG10_big_fil_rev_8_21_14_0_10_44_13]|nr:MAG: hypothetical protein COV19_02685 [Candidatus Woesearchaeota archaeon CG10_big_fil_rev_8_21_14_0_10_44_13]
MAGIRKSVFEELEKVRGLVKMHFPDLSVQEMCPLLSRLATYHYNKRKGMIVGKERELYNALIENSYNPFTVYRWALLERVPEEIKFQLRNHYLSQKKAIKLFFERRHETETGLQIDIKQLGLRLIKEM